MQPFNILESSNPDYKFAEPPKCYGQEFPIPEGFTGVEGTEGMEPSLALHTNFFAVSDLKRNISFMQLM